MIHEDGFNAFRQRCHGTTALQKGIRKDTLRVYNFAPSSYIPEGVSHKFDAFPEPLVEELKNLYVYGMEVVIQEEISTPANLQLSEDIENLVENKFYLICMLKISEIIVL